MMGMEISQTSLQHLTGTKDKVYHTLVAYLTLNQTMQIKITMQMTESQCLD